MGIREASRAASSTLALRLSKPLTSCSSSATCSARRVAMERLALGVKRLLLAVLRDLRLQAREDGSEREVGIHPAKLPSSVSGGKNMSHVIEILPLIMHH